MTLSLLILYGACIGVFSHIILKNTVDESLPGAVVLGVVGALIGAYTSALMVADISQPVTTAVSVGMALGGSALLLLLSWTTRIRI